MHFLVGKPLVPFYVGIPSTRKEVDREVTRLVPSVVKRDSLEGHLQVKADTDEMEK